MVLPSRTALPASQHLDNSGSADARARDSDKKGVASSMGIARHFPRGLPFSKQLCCLANRPYLPGSLQANMLQSSRAETIAAARIGGRQRQPEVLRVQGFDGDVLAVLQRRFPAEMMDNLQSFSHGALLDIKEAFPDDTILPNSNLWKFLQANHS